MQRAGFGVKDVSSGWVPAVGEMGASDTESLPSSEGAVSTLRAPSAAAAASVADTHEGNASPGPAMIHSISASELLASERGDESMLRHIRDVERDRAVAYRQRVSSDLGSAGAAAMLKPPPFFEHTLPLVRQGFTAIVDDSFTRCFKSKKVVRWNWNCYLLPAYCIGVVVRYCILFPLRLLCLMLGFLLVAILFPCVKLLSNFMDTNAWELALVRTLATAFVMSWSGVIRIHGIRPSPRPGQSAGVFVANHSSMNDFILLLQSHPYAVVGQKHTGWVGFLQRNLLSSMNCVWFDRGAEDDKRKAADILKSHVLNVKNAVTPALIFPEGTCVNNEYVVQFKKFVFELGVPINPIAIKYNKVFVEGYWNSRQESFQAHLFRIMTSWAMVVDVWFMDPVRIAPGESGAAFAQRVQRMIAARAGLKAVDWDGYMKYWRPSEKFILKRQEDLAHSLVQGEGSGSGSSSGGGRKSGGPSSRHVSMSEAPPVGGAAGAGGGAGASRRESREGEEGDRFADVDAAVEAHLAAAATASAAAPK